MAERRTKPAVGMTDQHSEPTSTHEVVYSAEVTRVTGQLESLTGDYAKAIRFRGVVRTADQLTERARAKACHLYEQAVHLVESAGLPAVEQAALLICVNDEMTQHMNEADKAAAEAYLRMEHLPDTIGSSTYAIIGKELAAALGEGPLELGDDPDTLPVSLRTLTTLPPSVREHVLERFVGLNLLQRNEDGALLFGTNRKAAERLRTGAVETARLAHRIVSADLVAPEMKNLDDVDALYGKHDEESQIAKVEIASNTQRAKILPINELRLGHQDAREGLRLVRQTVELINTLTDEEKPNVILVTNLIQGEFAHLQSARRASLATGMDTNNAQFSAAHMLLDELRATGIPVVLSLGRDDHRIARDNTIDVMRELNGLAKEGGKDNFVPYYNLNKIQQDAQFQRHLKFQLEYALPLSYSLGRSLRTASEMKVATDGAVTTSEYLALYAHVKHGESLPEGLDIDPSLLVKFGEWRDSLCVVDDVNLSIATDEQETNIWYRHSVSGFTPETLLQAHMDSLLGALGAMGTNGAPLPSVLMTGGSQEGVYATRSGAGAVSLPGLTDPGQAMSRGQRYTAVPGDPTRRMNLLRKRPSSPAIEMYEQWDTGEILLSYVNKDLMERADSIPRMAVIELCDFQIGSPTARPDYQIKYLSYILELAKRMPIAIQFAGDIIHGNIYPGFADESQAIGLIKIESQKQMVSSMLKKAFWGVPQSLLDSVIDVLVQQGNHDEIQKKRTPNNHDTNIDYIVRDFERILDDSDDPKTKRVRHNSVFRTETGVPVPTWMGRSEYGDYKILTAHYHVMRGMKGNSGGLPVYHSYARAVGLGSEERANILMGAHWHNPQSAVLGNKLVVVGGAMAEQSQFEDMLGYSAALSGTVVFLGGGKPPAVMSVTPEALDRHGVQNGWFTPENLADHGFHDDPGFDVRKHGPYSPDYLPKSGLQKALLKLGRDASQLIQFESPHFADADEQGSVSPQTQRIMAATAHRAAAY